MKHSTDLSAPNFHTTQLLSSFKEQRSRQLLD